jgi:alpha-glucosidase
MRSEEQVCLVTQPMRRRVGRGGAVAATILCLVLLPVSCARLDPPSGQTSATVLSPDGRVAFRLWSDGSRLWHAVKFNNKPVLDSSPLIVSMDGIALTDAVEWGATKRYKTNETYPWRGIHSIASNHCNGATIAFRHGESGTPFTIEVRVFNDGIGFRHIVPGRDTNRVPDEATKFVLPAGSRVWRHGLEGHYEAAHTNSDVATMKSGEWCAPPLTFELPNGNYASITEAALMNYSGMALQADGQRGFNVVLGDKHHVSYPFRLRYSNDIARLSRPAAVRGDIFSPWRVVMMGRDLNALVNSDIVHNLCPAADPKLFTAGMQTDWVKPGRAVWRYLDGGRNTLEEVQNFSRWAGELGFEYQVVEGLWSRWSDEQIKEAVDYARQQGVGLWFWRHSRELRTPEAREQFFSKLERLGIVGAKIDFFDHEHKEVIDLYYELLAGAARHHIMVNFHGANKPTGESRAWPNEMIRESVRGMESSRLQERARHNTTLPFTRYLAGHGDYTPVIFGNRRGDTTWAHQIATAAIFNEPLLTYGAHPTNLLAHPAREMIQSIPAVWDETRVLPPSEIGELAVFARRRGEHWFLAVINGPQSREIKIPLSFLGPGDYRAATVCDLKNEPAAVQIGHGTNRRRDSLKIELSAGGGFIARFENH